MHSVAFNWHNGGYARYSLESQKWLDRTLVSSVGLRDWMKERGHKDGEGDVLMVAGSFPRDASNTRPDPTSSRPSPLSASLSSSLASRKPKVQGVYVGVDPRECRRFSRQERQLVRQR